MCSQVNKYNSSLDMEVLAKARRRSHRLIGGRGGGGHDWRPLAIELREGAYNNREEFMDMLQGKLNDALRLASIAGK